MLEIYWSFFKIGLFTFGGGYGMLPIIENELITNKKWITKEKILDYYALSQVTPGVISINVATFVGYDLKGNLGGVIATLGVVTPSLIIISLIAAFLGNLNQFENILKGINIVVCVLMTKTLYEMFLSNVKTIEQIILFASAFIANYYFQISVVTLILIYAVIGVYLQLKKVNK